MVIEDDDIRATTPNAGDFPRRIRAAVHRHEEPRRVFLKAALDSRCAQPVAVLGPEREEAAHLRAGGSQNALKKRQRRNAIDIVVSIEDDSLARFNCAADTVDRLLHLRKNKRVFQSSQAGLEKVCRQVEVPKAVSNEDPGKKLRNAQLPAQTADGEIAIRAGKDPSPLHARF